MVLKVVGYIGPALGQDNRAEFTQADLTQADLTQGRVDPHSVGGVYLAPKREQYTVESANME